MLLREGSLQTTNAVLQLADHTLALAGEHALEYGHGEGRFAALEQHFGREAEGCQLLDDAGAFALGFVAEMRLGVAHELDARSHDLALELCAVVLDARIAFGPAGQIDIDTHDHAAFRFDEVELGKDAHRGHASLQQDRELVVLEHADLLLSLLC